MVASDLGAPLGVEEHTSGLPPAMETKEKEGTNKETKAEKKKTAKRNIMRRRKRR